MGSALRVRIDGGVALTVRANVYVVFAYTGRGSVVSPVRQRDNPSEMCVVAYGDTVALKIILFLNFSRKLMRLAVLHIG